MLVEPRLGRCQIRYVEADMPKALGFGIAIVIGEIFLVFSPPVVGQLQQPFLANVQAVRACASSGTLSLGSRLARK